MSACLARVSVFVGGMVPLGDAVSTRAPAGGGIAAAERLGHQRVRHRGSRAPRASGLLAVGDSEW